MFPITVEIIIEILIRCCGRTNNISKNWCVDTWPTVAAAAAAPPHNLPAIALCLHPCPLTWSSHSPLDLDRTLCTGRPRDTTLFRQACRVLLFHMTRPARVAWYTHFYFSQPDPAGTTTTYVSLSSVELLPRTIVAPRRVASSATRFRTSSPRSRGRRTRMGKRMWKNVQSAFVVRRLFQIVWKRHTVKCSFV